MISRRGLLQRLAAAACVAVMDRFAPLTGLIETVPRWKSHIYNGPQKTLTDILRDGPLDLLSPLPHPVYYVNFATYKALTADKPNIDSVFKNERTA